MRQFFTKVNDFGLILKLQIVAIKFTKYISAYFYVFIYFFIDYAWTAKKAVQTGFLGSWHIRQPVAVAVCLN